MTASAFSNRILPALLLALAVAAPSLAQEKQAGSAEDVLLPLQAVTGEPAPPADEEKLLLADASDGRLSRLSLAEAVLIADGVGDPDARAAHLAAIASLEKQARQKLARSKAPAEKAGALLRWLHAGAMKQGYSRQQSSIATLLETGSYNCVSSTALYVVLARRLGLDVRSVQVPGHLFAVLHVGERRTDIETTHARGFNPPGKRPTAGRREVGELGLVGAVYGNRIAHLDRARRHDEALRAGLCALRVDPGCPLLKKNTAAVLVNWRATLGKDGQFEQAARAAAEGLRLFPKDSNLRNNHHAALARLVKEQVEGGDHEGALAALARHEGEPADARFVKKLRAGIYGDWVRVLMEDKDWQEAVRVLKLACEQFPQDRSFRTALKQCKDQLAATDRD
jgi:tetratricopeptide (TPR) repeat protein